MLKKYTIQRIMGDRIEVVEDSVIEESPLTLFINNEEFLTVVCTPQKQEFLAIGFLKSEGFIEDMTDIERYAYDAASGSVTLEVRAGRITRESLHEKRLLISGCARGVSFYNYDDALKSKEIKDKAVLDLEKILRLMKEFQQKSELFIATGGVHSAALADGAKILIFAEDIGRHNAVDKVIGESLVAGTGLEDKILLSSGRISGEVMLKAARVGLPAIVSRSAPTSIAVNIARELNMTLIGFARGGRANIYS